MATDVSLTTGGITFTFDNGSVSQVKSTIVANTEQQGFSGQGPGTALLLDTEGPTKVINVTGELFDAITTRTSTGTIATILSQKQWLESLINANQGTIFFTSNYETQSVLSSSGGVSPFQGSFTNTVIKVEKLEFTENEGDPNKIEFNMDLKVGQ